MSCLDVSTLREHNSRSEGSGSQIGKYVLVSLLEVVTRGAAVGFD